MKKNRFLRGVGQFCLFIQGLFIFVTYLTAEENGFKAIFDFYFHNKNSAGAFCGAWFFGIVGVLCFLVIKRRERISKNQIEIEN